MSYLDIPARLSDEQEAEAAEDRARYERQDEQRRAVLAWRREQQRRDEMSTARGAIGALTTKFQDEYAVPALARLAALRDRERQLYEEDHGLGAFDRAPEGPERAIPQGIAEERAALRQRVGAAAAVVKEEAARHARATKAALDRARLTNLGADLGQAAYLAATTHPDLLVDQAHALAATDAGAAATRAAAAKLTGRVRPSVLDAMTRAVEAALDASVPERRAAVGAHGAAMDALTALVRTANAAERQAAELVGDRRAAAVASIGEKLAGRQAAGAAE